MSEAPIEPQEPVEVPDNVAEDWHPDGYEPGDDEPGDVDTECGPGDGLDEIPEDV